MHQLLGMRIRQRFEHRSVGDAEHRGIRADAECKNHDRGGGKSRRAAQPAQGIAHILHKPFDPGTRAMLTDGFLGWLEPIDGHPACARGRGCVGAGLPLFVGDEIDVALQLLVQIAIGARLEQQISNGGEEATEGAHVARQLRRERLGDRE